jgi:hypothetical protein
MAGSVLVQAPFPSPTWHGHLDSFPSGARRAMDAFLDRLVVLEANREKGIRLSGVLAWNISLDRRRASTRNTLAPAPSTSLISHK